MAKWRKSSRSGSSGSQSDCVEVASRSSNVGIRDSKAPQRGHLIITPQALEDLLTRIKAGKYDF